MKRLDMRKQFPECYKILSELDKLILESGIPPLHIELIKIRASQINGCAYCLDIHIADALKMGEDQRRINFLSAWREATEWFNQEEQTLLLLTEEISLISKHGLSDEVYTKAVNLFGATKVAYLIMAVININSWNRIGVSLNSQPVKR